MTRFLLIAARAALSLGLVAFALSGAEAKTEARGADLSRYGAGTIVISNSQRALYLVQAWGEPIRYSVAVGKDGKRWLGETSIAGKYREPDWSPPAAVKRDHPSLPNFIAGGTKANPMGLRAMKLARGQYAIHGTNRPESIGKYASYGCIRMLNKDITDLFDRVSVGDRVIVVP